MLPPAVRRVAMAAHPTPAARAPAWRRRALPTTRLGRVACWLAVAFVAWLFVATPLLMVIGEPADVLPQPVFALLVTAALGAGIVGGVLALVAILRHHERGLLVYATVVVSLFALGLLVAELFFME